MIIVDEEFSRFIPPLQPEEFKQLKENVISDGCRDPLVIWGEKNILVDGHNRYRICSENKIPYKTVVKNFFDRDEAILWIIDNQMGRRNLQPIDKVPMAERKRGILEKAAKDRQIKLAGARPKLDLPVNLPEGSKLPVKEIISEPTKGDTRDHLAASIGVSGKTYDALAKTIKHGTPELIESVRNKSIGASTAATISEMPKEEQRIIISKGDTAIVAKAREIQAVKQREVKREAIIQKVESVKAIEAKTIKGVYDVIVIDPPWPMQKIERDERPNQSEFDYPTMSEEELNKLSIPSADDCHIWLWTTHKFLPMAFRLLDVWGLKYVCMFTWHKPGGFQPFGLPQYNCEFALYARKGAPEFIDTKAFPVCFSAARGVHSEKPIEFYETVSRTTAGRRLDMFSRRKIKGFDSWGKEAV